MSAIMSRWSEILGQLEVVRTYYARLTDRERMIVLTSAAAAALFVLLSVYYLAAASANRLEERIERSRSNLEQIERLRRSHAAAEERVNELEAMIRRTAPGFMIQTHLERIATKHGVHIDSFKDVPVRPSDLYKESQVAVTVREITLLKLIDFLYEIENSMELLRIASIQVKPSYQDPTKLSLGFVVSTFQPLGAQ